MDISEGFAGREAEIAALFARTFAASEGEAEGALIGGLVRDMMAGTAAEDIHVFTAAEGGALLGAVIFTRIVWSEDARAAFILSPAAVAPERQGEGIGQALIRFALDALREAGVEVALTYGDPNYYGKVGFAPVTEAVAPAPQPLSQPEGWLALSLAGESLTPLRGASRCVPALMRPELW